MKSNHSTNAFAVPGETEWEWWEADRKGVWEKTGRTPSAKAASGYAFSAFACHSYPLWVNSIDPEVVRQVVPMELEEMGAISAQTASSHHDFRIIEKETDRALVHAIVIPDEIDDDLGGDREFVCFAPAACLFSYPRNRIIVWKEAERFVFAFTREGRLVHFHGFGKSPFSEEMIREVGLIYAGLHERELVDEVAAVLSWSSEASSPVAVGIVQDFLGVPIESAAKPLPNPLAVEKMDLIPESVVLERETQKRRAQLLRYAVIAAVIILCLVAGAFFNLFLKEKEIEKLREKIAIKGPSAEKVRQIRERWEALEPAVEVGIYPLELFHRVALTLPEKGVRLTYFGMEGQDIYLKGEASNVSRAINVGAALKDSPELRDYEWRLPSPDTSAALPKFEATGIYRFAKRGNKP